MSSRTTHLTGEKLYRALTINGMEPEVGPNPDHTYSSFDPSRVVATVQILLDSGYKLEHTATVYPSKYLMKFCSPSNSHPYSLTLALMTTYEHAPQLAMMFYNEEGQLEQFVTIVGVHLIDVVPTEYTMKAWKLAKAFQQEHPTKEHFWVPESILSGMQLAA